MSLKYIYVHLSAILLLLVLKFIIHHVDETLCIIINLLYKFFFPLKGMQTFVLSCIANLEMYPTQGHFYKNLNGIITGVIGHGFYYNFIYSTSKTECNPSSMFLCIYWDE